MRRLLTKFFGDPNEVSVKPFQAVVPEVNAFEPKMEALSDDQLLELGIAVVLIPSSHNL